MQTTPDAVMRTWFEAVWNQGDDDAIDRLLAPEGRAHGLPGGTMHGPGAFRPMVRAFRGAFPDMHVAIARTITEGDMIAVHCRVTGTHTGDTLGVAATHRRVDFEGVCLARVQAGQIHEGWNTFDFLTMYQQLGVVPPVPG